MSVGPEDTRYRDLFEASADAILLIKGDTFIDCNMATVKMLRYASKEELLQTHPSQLSPEYQADGRFSFDKANEMMRLAVKNGNHRFEWLHKRADGEIFPVEVLLTAVPEDGEIVLHTVWRDITDRKLLEDELRQAQKMEAVGKLAGGIAHDFNNLLMAIIGNTEMLKDLNEPDTEDYPFIAEIMRASLRAANLIEQLLAYSRKQILQPSVVDLGVVMREFGQILGRLLGEDIKLVLQLEPGPQNVLIDRGQLEQVIMNLANNARDAMPGGGVLTFSTSLLHVGLERQHDAQRVPPGNYVVLTVNDTGVGIQPGHLENIFDPFFTTKVVGKGTGLGLSTVYGIIKQSNGEIEVTSEEGLGTTFKIYLPLHENTVTSFSPEGKPVPIVKKGNESILLVEDETAILGLLEKVLSNQGYRVHTASNGLEALALVESKDISFDLLLTDVVMPEVSGTELANRLLADLQDLKVIYISGYTNSVLLRRGLLEGDVDLVQKPFRPQEILDKVREVLDRV